MTLSCCPVDSGNNIQILRVRQTFNPPSFKRATVNPKLKRFVAYFFISSKNIQEQAAVTRRIAKVTVENFSQKVVQTLQSEHRKMLNVK